MAGFLGMGNFSRPGKGVKKTEPTKKRFFQFFDLYFRKFWNLVKLNLLFLLFCIPIVTIGPAISAMMKIVRYYNEEKPVFLFSDFWDAFKENFFQSFVVSLIDVAIGISCWYAFIYYMAKMYSTSGWFVIPVIIILLLAVMTVFANFYIFLIIVTVRLNLFAIFKNAIMFIFIGIKTNLLTLLFAGGILIGSILFFPITLPILLLITFSTTSMIVCFNSFQYIYKYLVKPYYIQSGLPNPYEPEEENEPIFTDSTL